MGRHPQPPPDDGSDRLRQYWTQRPGGILTFREPAPPPLPTATRLSTVIIVLALVVSVTILAGPIGALVSAVAAPPLQLALLNLAQRLHDRHWEQRQRRDFQHAYVHDNRVMVLPPEVRPLNAPDEPEQPAIAAELRHPAWKEAGQALAARRRRARDTGMMLVDGCQAGREKPCQWIMENLTESNIVRLHSLMEFRPDTEDLAEFHALAELIGAAYSGYNLTELEARPELDRPFTARTDCARGHLDIHDIGETFTGTDGRRRIRRTCHCGSQWSEIA